jgi:hypothetical protein
MTETYVPKQENNNDKNYSAYLSAENDVVKVLGGISKVRTVTQHDVDAEKIILEKWAPKMDEALRKSRYAFDTWINGLQGN